MKKRGIKKGTKLPEHQAPVGMLTIREVSKLLKLTEYTVRKYCRDGKLPGIHLGKYWYINKKKLYELLNIEEN